MAKLTINTGTSANSRDGDSLRSAFTKINANFTELYTALGLDDTRLNLGAFEFTGSTISTTDSTSIVINQPTTVTGDLTVGGDVVPSVANGGNLGSLERPFNSLYVSTNTVYFGGVPLSLDSENNNLLVNSVPISQTVTYAEIPNAPTDIADLTDNTGLLGGGGADLGDFTIVGSTLQSDSLTIETTDGDMFLEADSDIIAKVRENGYLRIQELEDEEQAFVISPTAGSITFPDGTEQTTAYIGGGGDFSGDYNDLINKPTLFSGDYNDLTNRPELFSGDYADLDNKPSIPADVSDLTDTEGLLGSGTNSYTPDDPDHWNSPTVNTVQAALDELAAKVAALENFEIDGGNAYTPAAGELIIDGNGA